MASNVLHYHPCTGSHEQRHPIVLIHGWGADSQIWQTIPDRLSAFIEVYSLDLPGCGESPIVDNYSEASLLEWMAEVLPNHGYLLGLSLGGMLCRAFAAQYPTRVAGLITISSSLNFVATEQHPEAMAAADFAEFMQHWEQDRSLCLRRFLSLQTQGDSQQRRLIKQLHTMDSKIDDNAGGALLALLGGLDNRPHRAKIECPSLDIFGARDALVPVAVTSEFNSETAIIFGAGHLPHLSAADTVLQKITLFLDHQLYRLDKQKVAASFGRAAARYDEVAQLQRRIGQQLLETIPAGLPAGNMTDLGCGTGYHTVELQRRFPASQIIGVDLSLGMLAHAQAQYPDCTWLCTDAENMDLASDSQDLMFSNFALQWCDNLPTLAAELYRVLAADGRVYLAVPGPATLSELRQAWSEVDGAVHVNRFASLPQWQLALSEAGFSDVNLDSRRVIEQHQSVRELLLELKNFGAHNNNAGKANHLTGKQQLKGLYNAYDSFRLPDGMIPATWEIISGFVVK